MRRLLALSPILLVAACSAAQSHSAQASGQRAERGFEVAAFQSVALQGPHNVVVTVGGQPSVRAEGDSAALDMLDIRVENGRLVVATRRGWSWSGPHGEVTVRVTVPALNEASIGGSGDMRIDRVQGDRFEASIGGSGGIRATGTTETADISIAGSGDMVLDSLQTRRTHVSVMGSGNIAVQASEAVDGSIMGSGDVTVRGAARCSISRMGSGTVTCGESNSGGQQAD